MPGIDAPGVYGVQTLDDGEAVRAALDAERRRAGRSWSARGYIGVEMAEALIKRGLEVTVVDAAPQPMSTLDPDMGALVAEAMDGPRHHHAHRRRRSPRCSTGGRRRCRR